MTTDSVGRYALTDVSPGKYVFGFSHAVLDSIGIEPPFVRIEVGSPPGARRIDLGVPGPAQIFTAVCGAVAKDSVGVVALDTCTMHRLEVVSRADGSSRSGAALAWSTTSSRWRIHK